MKNKAMLAFILGMLLAGGGLFGAQTQVIFDLSLYKAVPANGAKVFVRWTTSKAQGESPGATYFYTGEAVRQGQGENEIKKVFRVQDLERTAATRVTIQYDPDMIRNKESNDYFSAYWEGHYGVRGPLLEVALSDGKKYDIRIIPLDVDNAPCRFKLQIHEPKLETRSEDSHGIKGGVIPSVFYVDVEFSLPMGDTTVIGFADSKDTPYFLSITLDAVRSGKTNARTETPIGGPVGGLLEESKAAAAERAEERSGQIKTGQPETIRTIAPEYPESCRSKAIEGSVGLEVSVDAEGRPTDIKVVNSAHPDLDKAAVVAVKQWLFKPLMVAGKAKAAVYLMTVDFATHPGASVQGESDLSSLLARAADYCDKLSSAVLDFVCRERIDEWFYGKGENYWLFPYLFDNILPSETTFVDSPIERYSYIYDYQFVRDKTGHMRENRTLLQEQGKKVELGEAPLKTHVFKYADVVMGPLDLLSRKHQTDFDYKISREEKFAGEPTVVVEAVPKPGVHPDYLFGTIWLRKSDAGILKVQWNPVSMENYAGVENIGRKLRMKPDILMTSEYAFEKSGICFPSRYNVKERYFGYRGRFERSETNVIYDQYRFFTVETEVKY